MVGSPMNVHQSQNVTDQALDQAPSNLTLSPPSFDRAPAPRPCTKIHQEASVLADQPHQRISEVPTYGKPFRKKKESSKYTPCVDVFFQRSVP